MKKSVNLVILLFLMSVTLFSCLDQESSKSNLPNAGQEAVSQSASKDLEKQKEEARNAVYNLMKSYEESIKNLDLEKTLQHYSQASDFLLISDGQVSNYDEFSKGLGEMFPNLEKVEGGFDTMYIHVLTTEVVNVMAPFQETFVDKSGNKTSLKGEVTWTAMKKGEEWKFVYGHTFHLPNN